MPFATLCCNTIIVFLIVAEVRLINSIKRNSDSTRRNKYQLLHSELITILTATNLQYY